MSDFTRHVRGALSSYRGSTYFMREITEILVNMLEKAASLSETNHEDRILLSACNIALEKLLQKRVAPQLRSILLNAIDSANTFRIELEHSDILRQYTDFLRAVGDAALATPIPVGGHLDFNHTITTKNDRVTFEATIIPVDQYGRSYPSSYFKQQFRVPNSIDLKRALGSLPFPAITSYPTSDSSVTLPFGSYHIVCSNTSRMLWESCQRASNSYDLCSTSGQDSSPFSVFYFNPQGDGVYTITCSNGGRMLWESNTKVEGAEGYKVYCSSGVEASDDSKWKVVPTYSR